MILNRRYKICQFCGAESPSELLLSKAEIEEMEVLEKEETERKAKRRRKESDEPRPHGDDGRNFSD